MASMFPDPRAFVRLAAELRRDLGSASERLEGLASRRVGLPGGDPVLASFFTLSLHSYYTAIETSFERIARHLDGGAPTGERSHQELLEAMALELPGLRPAVISPPTLENLRELLGFRHFVRHAYAVTWHGPRLGALADLALGAHGTLVADFDAFLGFVDALGAL